MAKTSGPLFSMEASGKFGGALVFGKWKGRPTVRKLVTPANPKSADQEIARNAMRVLGAAQHWANATTQQESGVGSTDKAMLIAVAPAGQAWNGFLIKSAIGANQINYNAASAAYSALTAPQKTAWDSAAAALSPAIPAVAQKAAGGAPATNMSAGEVFFHYRWGLYIADITGQPDGDPPNYV